MGIETPPPAAAESVTWVGIVACSCRRSCTFAAPGLHSVSKSSTSHDCTHLGGCGGFSGGGKWRWLPLLGPRSHARESAARATRKLRGGAAARHRPGSDRGGSCAGVEFSYVSWPAQYVIPHASPPPQQFLSIACAHALSFGYGAAAAKVAAVARRVRRSIFTLRRTSGKGMGKGMGKGGEAAHPRSPRCYGTQTKYTLLELCSVPALVILYAIWDLLVISASASADPYIFSY